MTTVHRKYMQIGCLGALALFSGAVSAQVSVIAGGTHVKIAPNNDASGGTQVKIGPDNDASNESGGISGDVEIEGIAILNDKVYIDGVRVPRGTREVTSKKTGKTYRIVWGKDGNITVTEK